MPGDELLALAVDAGRRRPGPWARSSASRLRRRGPRLGLRRAPRGASSPCVGRGRLVGVGGVVVVPAARADEDERARRSPTSTARDHERAAVRRAARARPRRRGARAAAAPNGLAGRASETCSWIALVGVDERAGVEARGSPRRCAGTYLTKVGPGRRPHSSSSIARRYFARIFVACSTSMMSMRAASAPHGAWPRCRGMRVRRLFARPSDRPPRPTAARPGVWSTRGRSASVIEHLAGLRALVAGDHPAALEHVDQPPGAGVAEAQAALEHRGRGGAHPGPRARSPRRGAGPRRGRSSSSPSVSVGSSSTSSSSSSRSSGSPCLRQKSVIFSICASSM